MVGDRRQKRQIKYLIEFKSLTRLKGRLVHAKNISRDRNKVCLTIINYKCKFERHK